MNATKTVRIAIVSDTHTHLSPEIISIVEGCDGVVHAGDIGSHAVLQQLHASTGEVIAVRGNNDEEHLWADHESDVVNALSRVETLSLPGGTLVVEHGHLHGFHKPDHARLRLAHPGARVIVYGHTHQRVIDQSDEPWVVNPGAAGKTRNHGGPSCLVLNANPDSWEFESFQFPDRNAAVSPADRAAKA